MWIIAIKCDGCGRMEQSEAGEAQLELWDRLFSRHWQMNDNKHFCPPCVVKLDKAVKLAQRRTGVTN